MGAFNADTKYIGRKYIWIKETDSTNSMMMRMLGEKAGYNAPSDSNAKDCKNIVDKEASFCGKGPAEGMMIISDFQSLGRGRKGKSWVSPAGTCLAMSLLLMPKSMEEGISCVTLVAAMSVSSAIKKISGLEAEIKWPNDILVNKKKVCGILTELDTSKRDPYLIVGVGINVNQRMFPEELKETATSVFLESKAFADRELIVKYFAEYFERYYEIFLKTFDMSLLKEEYNALLVSKGKEVRVLDPKGDITGVAEGIDTQGRLKVKTDDGLLHRIYAGEVSVRGIYGYV